MKRFLLSLALLAAVQATASAANPVVLIETPKGNIQVELNEEKAPITVKNFLGYVDDKFYDDTIFHRVISNFMIQGGGFEAGMKEKKTKDPIKNEADNGLKNDRGTIAMARTKDPDSATCQFYINVKDNTQLDFNGTIDPAGYCVFGQVIEGQNVVNAVKQGDIMKSVTVSDVPNENAS